MPRTVGMPALFMGHGSPMHIIEQDRFALTLSGLGKTLPRPKAILVISAHWLTHGTHITGNNVPRQIYDFYGFPPELYQISYTPPGAPELALSIAEKSLGTIQCDNSWGLDHASWSLLNHMYPEADIPVLEMSLDLSLPVYRHVEIGRSLQYLRREGVLVIGSGNIVHNLRMVKWEPDSEPYPWAVEFDSLVREALMKRQFDLLTEYTEMGHSAQMAIPTPDHYLPMLYILGITTASDSLRFIYEGLEMGSMSMRSFLVE